MMKLNWNRNGANSSTSKGLLRRLSSRQVVVSTAAHTAVPPRCRSYSSLYEAPLVSPIEYEASHYGYRVVVNRFSSTLRTMNQNQQHNSYDHHKANMNDYNEYWRSSSSTPKEYDNLDILSSPEVQEILHSQHEWDDGSLPESSSTMLNQGGRQLQDTILDGGDYDSDCEEMSPTDWDDSGNNGRNNSVATMTEEQLFTAEDDEN